MISRRLENNYALLAPQKILKETTTGLAPLGVWGTCSIAGALPIITHFVTLLPVPFATHQVETLLGETSLCALLAWALACLTAIMFHTAAAVQCHCSF